jgi:ABC-2 type transport system ATP-binding protein
MSIKVKNLTKVYGSQKALDNVTLEIVPGQITGLLGPNGAGKTTMMKILTCFIPPTSGEAFVNDFDVLENSIEVRRIIGYLPEHNPLYPEMYVKEYLEFIGGIYKLPNLKNRVDEMVEITGLQEEYKKKISALSKGYRQRVGLAQALIHNPEVLILDEPTSGLDPNQLAEIRNLIRKIGTKKTVMLSTHIMQEVEAICDRVIIIHKGKIVADDSTINLHKDNKAEEVLIIGFSECVDPESFQSIPNIKSIEKLNEKTLKITSCSDTDIRPALFSLAADLKLTIQSLQKQEHSLEEIFQELTKNG